MVSGMHESALGQVEEVRLSNGLTLLLAPEPESEVFTIMLWVPAGVRTEAPGQSGISHFVEHCYSLGSAHLAPREIDAVVQSLGGTKNAFTSYDYTAYYANLPRSALGRIIELEADRFLEPLFPCEAVQKELEVVKEERRLRADNTIAGPVNERLFDLAYRTHPYRNPIVGRAEDIERFDAGTARQYFEESYGTDGATFILVGGFDLDSATEHFSRCFGGAPLRPSRRRGSQAEPELESEARALMRREGVTSSLLSVAYRGPDIDHPDAAAMALLSTILVGGRAGRLQRSLIRKRRLASSVSGGFWALRDPGPFQLTMVPQDGIDFDELEAAFERTVSTFIDEGPTEDELRRAKAQRLLSKLSVLESTQGRAHALGVYQTTSRRGFRAHSESFSRLRAVEMEDVRRVASRYLRAPGRVTVWQEPPLGGPTTRRLARASVASSVCDEAPASSAFSARAVGPVASEDAGLPTAQTAGVSRRVFDEGTVLLTEQTGRLPICAIRLSLEAGSALDPQGLAGLAMITADALRTGTDTLTEECVAEGFARFGTGLSVSPGLESVQLRLVARSADLAPVLELMMEVLTRPTLAPEVVDRLRAEHRCRLRTSWGRPSELLHLGMLRGLFGAHPYGRPVAGTPSGLMAVRAEDVREQYARLYQPSRMIVAIAGAFDPREAEAVMARSLAAWRPAESAEPPPRLEPLGPQPAARSIAIHKKSQTQAHIAMVQRVCSRTHDDWEKLVLLNALLGGAGLASRIPARVRTMEALAYSARSSLNSRDLTGILTFSAQTRIEGVHRAQSAIREEVTRLVEGDLGEAEFERIKARIRGSLPFRTETVAAKASALLTAERRGLPLDYLERQIARIERLGREEVLEAARRHIQLDAFTQVVVAPNGPALESCCAGRPIVRWGYEDFDVA